MRPQYAQEPRPHRRTERPPAGAQPEQPGAGEGEGPDAEDGEADRKRIHTAQGGIAPGPGDVVRRGVRGVGEAGGG